MTKKLFTEKEIAKLSKNPYGTLLVRKGILIRRNRLNGQCNQYTLWKVLLTDITYLNYSSGQRAYLSVIKNGSTGSNKAASYEAIQLRMSTVQTGG